LRAHRYVPHQMTASTRDRASAWWSTCASGRSPQGDRSPDSLKIDNTRARDADPNVNIIIREPGHVEYASTLGLGVYDRARIKVQNLQV